MIIPEAIYDNDQKKSKVVLVHVHCTESTKIYRRILKSRIERQLAKIYRENEHEIS